MPNQVTLTIAGESKGAEDAFNRVGSAGKKMGDDVGASSEGFKKAGEAADEVDTKAMGFRDTLTGVQDSMAGVAMLAKGPSFEGFLTLGMGIGDLGSGFYNFLIPALEKTKIATLASTAASKVAAAGTRLWTVAQRGLSLAFWASPIGLITAGIVILVGIIVLIATRTNWFQRIWRAAWSGIRSAASATWDYIKKIPGWISTAFSKIGNAVAGPFKAAFNGIARAWNSTVGQLSFSVPDWVPGIGGNGFSVPQLPTFHAGGTVPGVPGQAVPILAMAGETVGSNASRGGDSGGWVAIRGDAVMNDLVRAIASTVGAKGGRAAQLGIKFA